jgi:hypothetical protein
MVAQEIFGPDLRSLKGKTVRRRPLAVRNVQGWPNVPIPDRYRRVTLCMDIM